MKAPTERTLKIGEFEYLTAAFSGPISMLLGSISLHVLIYSGTFGFSRAFEGKNASFRLATAIAHAATRRMPVTNRSDLDFIPHEPLLAYAVHGSYAHHCA